MPKLWHVIGQRHCNLPLSRLFGKWEHIELHLRRKRKRNDELNNVTQVIVYERIGLKSNNMEYYFSCRVQPMRLIMEILVSDSDQHFV